MINMDKEQRMVTEFHGKFGFTINYRPTFIDFELFKVRHEHTLSEIQELKDAYTLRDMAKIADAIGDAVYFLKGTAVAFGIDLEPIFEEIHRSNMTKDRPEGGGDAKAVKGSNYDPPHLEKILADQENQIRVGRISALPTLPWRNIGDK